MDLTEALTDDTLADILGRLLPLDLAASRCVRKAWLAIIDAHGLLLPHVLTRTVGGLFFSCSARVRPRFLACPSTQHAIDGDLDFLPHYGGGSKEIVDHCNGLLLYRDLRTLCVVNPTTRRWEDVPWEDEGCGAYLVFDPATSLRYEVFSVQENPRNLDIRPPTLWTLNVFSSYTRQWKKMSFGREAEIPGTVTDMREGPYKRRFLWWETLKCAGSVYWRGSLYVHFRGALLVRFSLSEGKYRVIKTPMDVKEYEHGRPYIGKSEKGVYFATIRDKYRLQVWTLMESSKQVYWELKHHIDLEPRTNVGLRWLRNLEEIGKTWFFDDDNDVDGIERRLVRENLDWDSDDDNVVSIEDACDGVCSYVSFLGFHPYKEVVFLELALPNGVTFVAYHLNSSKFQYLGRLQPTDYSLGIQDSFPYTPCTTGHLLKHFRE